MGNQRRKYIITSGWCAGVNCPYPWNEGMGNNKITKSPEFHELWYEVLSKYTNPEKLLIIESPDKYGRPAKQEGEWVSFIKNFGHQVGAVEGKYAGWTRAWLLGMFFAWVNDCDHIFVEQDVLCFGNWIEALYSNLEENNLLMSFGAKEYAGGYGKYKYKQENSLTIIKKEAILELINILTSIDKTDKQYGVEYKIKDVREYFEKKSGFHLFGYGFRKPEELGQILPFYGHRWPGKYLKILAEANLIDKKYVK